MGVLQFREKRAGGRRAAQPARRRGSGAHLRIDVSDREAYYQRVEAVGAGGLLERAAIEGWRPDQIGTGICRYLQGDRERL